MFRQNSSTPTKYVWVTVKCKKQRSLSKKYRNQKQKTPIKCQKVMPRDYQQSRIRRLQSENKILKRQNAILHQYFHVFQKKRNEQKTQNIKVRQENQYYQTKRRQSVQNAQVTTCHSDKLAKKLLSFGPQK